MSAAVRKALAEAASAVEGVRVAPYYRQTTKTGDGWVRLDQVAYPNKFGGVVSWQVLVVLPSDQRVAEMWIDARLADLQSALANELHVTSAQPIQLSLDGSTLPALVINGNREQE